MISTCYLSKFQMNKVFITASKVSTFPTAPVLGHSVFLVWSLKWNDQLCRQIEGKIWERMKKGDLDLFSNKLTNHVIQESFPNHSMWSDSHCTKARSTHLGFNCSLGVWHLGALAPNYMEGSLWTEESLWNPAQVSAFLLTDGKVCLFWLHLAK